MDRAVAVRGGSTSFTIAPLLESWEIRQNRPEKKQA